MGLKYIILIIFSNKNLKAYLGTKRWDPLSVSTMLVHITTMAVKKIIEQVRTCYTVLVRSCLIEIGLGDHLDFVHIFLTFLPALVLLTMKMFNSPLSLVFGFCRWDRIKNCSLLRANPNCCEYCQANSAEHIFTRPIAHFEMVFAEQ